MREGKNFEEVCKLADDYLKHSRVFFALESFHNFAQNGRVSKLTATAAGILGIRVLATASTGGTIDIIAKCKGAAGTLKGFMKCLNEAGYAGGKVYIGQCKNLPFAEKIAAEIQNVYPGAPVSIYETRGLCSYYAEKGGLLLSCECDKVYE